MIATRTGMDPAQSRKMIWPHPCCIIQSLGIEVNTIHADNDSTTAARLKVEFADIEKKDDQDHPKKEISKRLHSMSTTHRKLKGA